MAAFVGGLVGIVAAGKPVRAETLMVAATPSLRAAFQEIIPMFEREHGASVHVIYGASQLLRRQIEKGAAIDVFLPASGEEVFKLQKKGLTINGGPRIYAQTSLVLVTSAASPAIAVSFRDALPNTGTRIALADPTISDLGAITARAIARLDPAYKSRFNVHYAQHAEGVVNLIQSGVADIGIVNRVDAINNGQVRIIDEAPAGSHTPVEFGEAVVWTCRKESLKIAEQFFDFIASPRIQKLLLKYGFDPLPENPSQG
jgi:molybdate transport system substrate-binding protein